MRIKTALFTGMLLMVMAAGQSSPAAAQTCSDSEGTSTINSLLTSLTPVLNAAWPSLAVSSGIDPLTNVLSNEQVPLKCSYGGDEICGVQAAACKKEYAEITVSAINGLSYMQFKDLAVNALTARPGTTCPYSSSANGGPYYCSDSGVGGGSAYLVNNGQITATLSKIKVKVQCEVPVINQKFTETLFSGSARCTGTGPSGGASFTFCGGSCQSEAAANLAYAGVYGLDLKLDHLSCDVSPSYNPVSWISDAIVPTVKDDIVKAITPPLEDALNDLLADAVPYPAKCNG